MNQMKWACLELLWLLLLCLFVQGETWTNVNESCTLQEKPKMKISNMKSPLLKMLINNIQCVKHCTDQMK